MPKASSVLVLAGLLVLWAELPPASAQNVTTKAGVCPDPATEEANCTVGCQSDGDCESTLKCCPAACGMACQEPDEKPGTCPPVKPGIPMLGLCANQCKTDSNCPGSLKCCRNGCGKVSCAQPPAASPATGKLLPDAMPARPGPPRPPAPWLGSQLRAFSLSFLPGARLGARRSPPCPDQ
ncbi:WAP four-disulfide core domain protein 2-like protein [Aix galericulata]|nr:WAP four-disulfide core domain protein 2-like protein [Aix galericulata]